MLASWPAMEEFCQSFLFDQTKIYLCIRQVVIIQINSIIILNSFWYIIFSINTTCVVFNSLLNCLYIDNTYIDIFIATFRLSTRFAHTLVCFYLKFLSDLLCLGLFLSVVWPMFVLILSVLFLIFGLLPLQLSFIAPLLI